MTSARTFEESLAFDALCEDPSPELERRLKTYSTEALRAAVQVEKVYVRHTQFDVVLQHLDRLFQLGTELENPVGMQLIGPPGVGKTALLRYFRDSLPKSSLFDRTSAVLAARVPKRPYAGHVIRAFLKQLQYPLSGGPYKSLYNRREVVFEAVRAKGTRMIMIDEAQHLVPRNSLGEVKPVETEVTEFLRELIDETKVSLVLASATDLDSQMPSMLHLSSRIGTRTRLKEFSLDVTWAGFLRGYAKLATAFDMSAIAEPDTMAKLHLTTNGNARLLRQLIVEAVLIAADAGKLKLDYETFRVAHGRAFGDSAARSNPFV